MPTPCFFLESTERDHLYLRRYHSIKDGEAPCSCMPGQYTYHNGRTEFGTASVERDKDGHSHGHESLRPPDDDPRWPRTCGCGYAFVPTDHYQVFSQLIYRRIDTGEEMTLEAAPPGALWFSDWLLPWQVGPDGHCLSAKLPDGAEWCIDSRANNCTLPQDTVHRCWVRHGDPRNPSSLTVDKNGVTCAAGAGSIQSPKTYHGFLQNGTFT